MAEQQTEERKVGTITHYYDDLSVGAIKLEDTLKVGDEIHIAGHTTDFTQTVESMQIDMEMVQEGEEGDEVGILVDDRVREGDDVYVVGAE